jgi:hypothetical protein
MLRLKKLAQDKIMKNTKQDYSTNWRRGFHNIYTHLRWLNRFSKINTYALYRYLLMNFRIKFHIGSCKSSRRPSLSTKIIHYIRAYCNISLHKPSKEEDIFVDRLTQ